MTALKLFIASFTRWWRRFRGQVSVLAVIVEYPDLPSASPEALSLISRLHANNSGFGTLQHYVAAQSNGRISVSSEVLDLGAIFPDWHDHYEPPPEEGLPPGVKKQLRHADVVFAELGIKAAYYDVVVAYYMGLHPQNANAHPYTHEFVARDGWPFGRLTVKYSRPLANIGLPVIAIPITTSIFHEVFHCLQFHYKLGGDHAPYLEGDENIPHTITQQNPWHVVSWSKGWGAAHPTLTEVPVSNTAWLNDRFGWLRASEKTSRVAPIIGEQFTVAAMNSTLPSPRGDAVYVVEIDTRHLPNHPDGYSIEARAKRGYDENIESSGVLLHKIEPLTMLPQLGPMAFLMGPDPPQLPRQWHRYVLTEGENHERPGLKVEVNSVKADSNNVPEHFVITVTVT